MSPAHTTQQDTRIETDLDADSEFPVIGPDHLIALARWIEQRFANTKGVESCSKNRPSS